MIKLCIDPSEKIIIQDYNPQIFSGMDEYVFVDENYFDSKKHG